MASSSAGHRAFCQSQPESRENQQGVYITDKQEAVTAVSVTERLTVDEELVFSHD